MTVLRYLGLAEEASYNVSPAPVAGFHVDIASASLDTPPDTQMIYGGGLRRGAVTHRPGYYHPEGNIVYAFDIRTIAFLLKWALGGYEYTAPVPVAVAEVQTLFLGGADGGTFVLGNGTVWTTALDWNDSAATIQTALEVIYGAGNVVVATDTDFTITFATSVGDSNLEAHFSYLTGATSPALTLDTPYAEVKDNLHEIWGSESNILPSFCARLGKDLFEHVFSGCVINSLEITVEGEFCQATANIIGAKDAKAAIKEIGDLLLPDEYPLAFHEVTSSIAAGDVSSLVKSLTLSINNNLSADAGRSIGSRFPRRLPANERIITLSKTLWHEDTAQLERYWGGSTGPADAGSSEFAVLLNLDAGSDGSMEISLPRFVYTQVQQQPSGRDEITQSVAGRALLTDIALEDASTVNSEILATIENGEGDIS